MRKKPKLILMRHGESLWNHQNIFTGWVDVPLSEKGIFEAIEGGRKIADIPIDVIFVSALIRAQMTAFLAMLHHSGKKVPVMQHPGEGKMESWAKIHNPATAKTVIPVYAAWQLSERMYGDLQGLNKAETAEQYGKEQVHIWRRSFDVPPPNGESLEINAKRTIPFFRKNIVSLIEKGETVFISAHGNSLRSIVMFLDNLSGKEVVKLELPTGEPLIYDFSDGHFARNHLS